jgi:hypothetical protein
MSFENLKASSWRKIISLLHFREEHPRPPKNPLLHSAKGEKMIENDMVRKYNRESKLPSNLFLKGEAVDIEKQEMKVKAEGPNHILPLLGKHCVFFIPPTHILSERCSSDASKRLPRGVKPQEKPIP